MEKPLSPKDVERMADQLQTFVGAHLQDVWLWNSTIALRFFGTQNIWLHMDLNPKAPTLFASRDFPQIKKGPPKPVSLFLHAHLKGAKLSAITYDPSLLRVLSFHFLDRGTIEIRLFPHGQNFIVVNKDKKKVSWAKVKELKTTEVSPENSSSAKPEGPGLSLFREIANQQRMRQEDALAQVSKRKTKIETAIRKIELDLKRKEAIDFAAIGEWLKVYGLKDVPMDWQQYVDATKSLAQNIGGLFAQAKANKLKLAGGKKRIEELQAELAQLESSTELTATVTAKPEAGTQAKRVQFKNKDIQARTFDLAPDLFFVVGKSAVDNLRILREAKPWHLWLHLRDYPGAHGIVTCNKGRRILDNELHLAAERLLKVQFGLKASGRAGERFDLLVAECRFVSPIKGDRHGRVTHTNTRTLRHEFQNLNS